MCQELAKKTNVLEEVQKKKRHLREKFEQLGGKAMEEHDKMEERIATLRQELEAYNSALRDISSGSAPLCLLENSIAEVYRQAKTELDIQNEQLLLNAIATRDASIVRKVAKSGFSPAQTKTLASILSENRKNLHAKHGVSDIYLNEAGENISSCPPYDLGEVRQKLLHLRTEIDIGEKRIVDIERNLAAKPDNESIKTTMEAIDEANKKIVQLKSEITLLEKQYASEQANITSKSKEIQMAYKEELETKIMKETTSRIAEHSERMRRTMETFKNELSKKHLRALEHFICESFQQLLRKKNFISRVEIEPKTFALSLYVEDGKRFNSEKLSAGERQLLAVAIVWGLAKAAGRPLPTIIDTPLGRLDSEHRDNIVKHYFPNASHQVILLSTDTEIDQKYYQMLKSSIGLEYRISFNKSKETSRFAPGYFYA